MNEPRPSLPIRALRFGISVVLIACAAPLQGRAESDLERDLNSKYEEKILVLHTPYTGEHLSFEPDGTLLKGGSAGTWALDGNVIVGKIKLNRARLDIEARRVYLDWNSDLRQFQPLPSSRVRIEIVFPQAGPAEGEVQRALAKVFNPATAPDPMPSYWKPVLEGKLPGRPAAGEPIGDLDGNPVYGTVAKDATPPRAIRCPDPPYTDEARRAKLMAY